MESRFYRTPMPAPLPPTKNPPNGNRKPLPLIVAGGVTSYDTNTQIGLLSAKNLDWGAWAITLDPQGQDPAVYDAPTVVGVDGGPGSVGCFTGGPRARLSWGVAGIIRTVEFDYPSVGGVIVVNANAIELSVRATNPTSGGNVLSLPENRATVGAWLTPHAAPAQAAQAQLEAGNLAQGPVPPFARYIVVQPFSAGPLVPIPAQQIRVSFLDRGLTTRWSVCGRFGIGTSGPQILRAPVPPWAVAVDISGTTDAGVNVVQSNSVVWELEFA